MAVSHAPQYRAARAPRLPQRAAARPSAAAGSRQAAGQNRLHNRPDGGKAAARHRAEAGEKLWHKLLAGGALLGAPAASLLLLAFVWQLGGALDGAAAGKAGFTSASNAAARPPQHSAYAAPGESRDATAGQTRLAFFLPAPAAAPPAEPRHSNRAYNSDLQFVHTGLVYSSLLVLIASICLALLLARLMARDKDRRRAYQTLLVKADTALENRVRHRTARLTAACHLAEKERQRAELLLQDTSHRVGNSLATVSSLLGLQLRQCHDKQVQKALLSARDRIQAISAAHRRLRLGKDMETASVGEFLDAVIHDIENGLTAAQRRHITITSRFEPCFLPARDVTTLGIILGELVTNAVKHAFPDKRPGEITVTFGKAPGKSLRLMVEDNGIGLPASLSAGTAAGQEPASRGLGQLIIAQLAAQFNAKPQFSPGAKGGSRIIIPLLNSAAENKKSAAGSAAA